MYIKDICGVALNEGYEAAVLNHHATKNETLEQRVLDMSDISVIKNAIEAIRERYGADVEIYGVGFSLGANHLLRYLGDNHEESGIKAAISISNPFDCMATCVRLRKKFFGIYDRSIHAMLSRPFLE